MRIVIVVQHLTGGGAERVAALWAKGFAQKGHEVYVVITNDQKPVTYLLPDNVKLLSAASHKKNKVLRVVERMCKFRRLFKKIRPQVAIDVQPTFDRIIARFGLGCYNVSTEHDSFERPKNAEYKLEWFRKYWINQLYDHVTVLTQADKDVIGKRLRHVSVLPNPLALEPAATVPHKERIVLAVGRKYAWHYKGFDLLIKAWAKIRAEVSGWKLQIVGDSRRGGQDFLEQLCRELSVTDSVEFPDFQQNIQSYYERAAVYVLSSRYEGFGLVLIEAMSQGCACVVCDYKGRQCEIVTSGVDGITCEPDNINDLAKAIRTLIVDEELCSRLQVNAVRRAGDFSIENIMDRWEEILRKVTISEYKKSNGIPD